MWHVDGNHKLIRWRFVIHGGIDGFSRTIVYLCCATNNKANTVLSCFEGAIENFGLPEKVRSDLGGENYQIWRYMIEAHSSQSAVVTGASTHNQRIERLWRDVTRSVGSCYRDIFYTLEESDQLDPLNEVDIFCLHWVFLPKINASLTQFVESWNNHPISTENNWTPNQLFVQGIARQRERHASDNNIGPNIRDGPQASNVVEVPNRKFKACDALETTLNAISVNSTSQPDAGVHEYIEISNVVGFHLNNGCNVCLML